MADLYSMIFMVQLIGVFTILAFEFWNLMSLGKLYGGKTIVSLFVGFFILYIFGFVIVMLEPEELLYSRLFVFETFFVMVHVLFLIVNLILKLYMWVQDFFSVKKARKPVR